MSTSPMDKRTKMEPSSLPRHRGMTSEDVEHFIKDLFARKSTLPNSTTTAAATATLFDDDEPLALVFDLDAFESTLDNLIASFKGGKWWLHTFAIKANPVFPMLKSVVAKGMGLECASWTEVEIALSTGCAPGKVVYDSPCKTRAEVVKALKAGVHINADNFEEVERVLEALLASPSKSVVGVRVNPLLGDGSIKELSVSNVYSKFGIPLTSENRARLIELFRAHPAHFRCLHAHVGSQGCSLEMLARGVEILVRLREEIEAGQSAIVVDRIDIGGGLSTNFDSDEVVPTFREYYEEIVRRVPSIEKLQREEGVTFITEFGRSVVAKAGCAVSNVEYVKTSADGRRDIAVMHAGSDLFVRTCYVPAKFPLRVEFFSREEQGGGRLVALVEGGEGREVDVVGPLCFGGDKIFSGRYPMGSEGRTITSRDVLVVRDAGANCLSLWSRHCSRPSPRVLGYRRRRAVEGNREREDSLEWIVLRRSETCEEVMQFWKM